MKKSGAGLPEKLPEYVKGSNTKIAPIVSTEKAAKVMLRIWKRKYNVVPDLLVIEGPKAGGHLGFSEEELEAFSSFLDRVTLNMTGETENVVSGELFGHLCRELAAIEKEAKKS